MVIKELDFNLLEEIARKHNLTTREVYEIYNEVDQAIVKTVYPVIVQEDKGYHGDTHSQEE